MEGALPTQLQPCTLETFGEYDFDGKLQTAMTAHPKMDPETGEMLFFGYARSRRTSPTTSPTRTGRLVRSEEIDIAWPSMIHDFVTTRDYVVFILCPLVFSFENIASEGDAVQLGARARHAHRRHAAQRRQRRRDVVQHRRRATSSTR